eukprot:COSAG04_NODE_7873_length_1053_cov_2.491614_1_plen_320_part_01
MRRSTSRSAAGGAAEEGAPERSQPSEREAVRGAAEPEPEPEFCDEQLAEPEAEDAPERFVAELAQLAELRGAGMISEEEFAAAKAKLLAIGLARQGKPGPLAEPEPEPEPEEDVESDESEDRTHGGGESIVPAGMSRQLSGATSTAALGAPGGSGAPALPTAAEFCGPTTGISLDGLLHMVELLEARHAGEPDVPREGEFIVHSASDAGVAYRNSPDMDDRHEDAGVDDGTVVHAVRQTDEWIEVEAGSWLPKQFLKPAPPVRATETLTTSDVCHACIKPMTTPEGWTDEATLTDAAQRWYKHSYVHGASGERRSEPPGG